MVKKLDTCYGIRKGRGAPVVVHSWTEVVNKVSLEHIAPCHVCAAYEFDSDFSGTFLPLEQGEGGGVVVQYNSVCSTATPL